MAAVSAVCGYSQCKGYGTGGRPSQAHNCLICGCELHSLCGRQNPNMETKMICWDCYVSDEQFGPSVYADSDERDSDGMEEDEEEDDARGPKFGYMRTPAAQDDGLPNTAPHERPRKPKAPAKRAPAEPAGAPVKKPKESGAFGSAPSLGGTLAVVRLRDLQGYDKQFHSEVELRGTGRSAIVWCRLCNKLIKHNPKSSLDQHGGTQGHRDKRDAYAKANKEVAETKKFVTDFFTKTENVAGSSLTEEVKTSRLRGVELLMECAIPLWKLDEHPRFKQVLERGFDVSLGDTSDLRRIYVPAAERREQERIRAELIEEKITLTFDSSNRLGDANVVVAHYCTKAFVLCSRLTAITTFESHLNGIQTATFLQKTVLTVCCPIVAPRRASRGLDFLQCMYERIVVGGAQRMISHVRPRSTHSRTALSAAGSATAHPSTATRQSG